MTEADLNDIVQRRMRNTGETYEKARAHVISLVDHLETGMRTGQITKIELPDGSAVYLEEKN